MFLFDQKTECFKSKKEKKKHIERLNFSTQFKTEFLLLLTGCRKVLEKQMLGDFDYPIINWVIHFQISYNYKKLLFAAGHK